MPYPDYSQPFYVGRNPRFRGVSSDGYLPALEPPQKPEEIQPEVRGKMYVNLRVDRKALELDSQIAELRGQFFKFKAKPNEYLDKPKRKKGRYLNE